MRTLTVLAIAVAVAATALGLKAVLAPGSSAAPESINRAVATSKTLTPHEIHLNYQSMKELPITEVKEPF
jgi:hypothetical protein